MFAISDGRFFAALIRWIDSGSSAPNAATRMIPSSEATRTDICRAPSGTDRRR
jgi:hypothetical protein